MIVNVHCGNGKAQITLHGRFDFNAHRDFKSSYDPVLGAADVNAIEVDLGQVEYLDSSALGMLLLLREKAERVNKAVALTNCHGTVQQVLEIANFGRLFPMH